MEANPLSGPGHSIKSPRTNLLTVCFLLLSFTLALICVYTRNIYDDEHTSLVYVNRSLPQIVQIANSVNVHPPGMYVLAHFAYQFIPSPRWMTLIVLALMYGGLSIFVFSLIPLFSTLRQRICFLLLATLHPQLFMWGLTIRWYGWWTPIALIVLVDALQLQSAHAPPEFSNLRAVRTGILLAALFYINYVTLIFLAALILSLLYRYSLRRWKAYALTLLLFALLIAPQLPALVHVHMQGADRQKSGVVVSLAHLAQGIFTSEAYLPWHPLAIAAFLCFSVLVVIGLIRAVQIVRGSSIPQALRTMDQGLASIVLFALCFGLLIGVSGLGVKPRNALILIPTLAPLFALVIGALRPRILQSALIGFFLLWEAVGIQHLVGRHGLAKANMNDRPEEVLAFVRHQYATDTATNCPILITYDPLLTLTAEESSIPNLLVLAPPETTLVLRRQPFRPDACRHIDVFWVHSYLGGFGDDGDLLNKEFLSSESTHPVIETHKFSFDPDAERKRKLKLLGNVSDLPDYRYVVKSAHLPVSDLPSILQSLPDFENAEAPQSH